MLISEMYIYVCIYKHLAFDYEKEEEKKRDFCNSNCSRKWKILLPFLFY